jgi:tRNA dimethylallyltransferase
MQVYAGFPVLTNQPTSEQRAAARHELVGIVEPSADFSAAEYAALARPLIEADLGRRGAALVVGGTGLYMRAALAPLAVAPAADLGLRAELEARAAAEGPAALHTELARLDPAAAAAIDYRNVRRVVRALEVVSRTGSAWSGREDLWCPDYTHPTLLVGLTLERRELYRRIDLRARLIVEGGAVEEVRLRLEGAAPSPARQEEGVPVADDETAGGLGGMTARKGIATAIGYGEIERLLRGEVSLDETVDHIAAATRRYARRQLTWLRKLNGLVIIDVQDRDPEDLAEEVLTLMSSEEHIKEPHHS